MSNALVNQLDISYTIILEYYISNQLHYKNKPKYFTTSILWGGKKHNQ